MMLRGILTPWVDGQIVLGVVRKERVFGRRTSHP